MFPIVLLMARLKLWTNLLMQMWVKVASRNFQRGLDLGLGHRRSWTLTHTRQRAIHITGLGALNVFEVGDGTCDT